VIEKAFVRLRVLAEAAWHSGKQRFFTAYDRMRTLFADLDAETRPDRDRDRPHRRGNEQAEPAAPRVGRVPENTRVYAVGDIHGRADLLRRLIDLVHADAAAAPEERIVLIFLGDYVDRGFQSKDVIDFLLSDELSRYETYFLKGNHEAAFETFLSDPSFGPQWARFGGAETLMSYNIQPPRAKTVASEWEAVCEQLNRDLPHSHRNFLSTLSLYATLGDYIFVHAGLRPGTALEYQTERDLLWIREEFLRDENIFDQIVIHGHTPIAEPHRDHRRIGIDTGAYLTGKLTAACLVGTEVSFLST